MPKLAITGAELFPLSNELPTLGRTRLLATLSAKTEKIFIPLPVQLVPSGEVAIVSDKPIPTATHNDPFHVIPLPPPLLKTVVPVEVQEVPFEEV
jgi:hypothetical protein